VKSATLAPHASAGEICAQIRKSKFANVQQQISKVSPNMAVVGRFGDFSAR